MREDDKLKPAEQARKEVEEWWHKWNTRNPDVDIADLITRLTPVYERAQAQVDTNKWRGYDTWEEFERALRERAERLQHDLTAALAGEDNQAKRAERAEAELLQTETNCKAHVADAEADVKRLRETVRDLLCAASMPYPAVPLEAACERAREALAATERKGEPCYCGVHPPHKDSRGCVPDNTATKTERKP